MDSGRRNGALLMLAAATLWSTGGVGVKTAVAEPMVVAGLRSAFALLFMLVVLALPRSTQNPGARPPTVPRVHPVHLGARPPSVPRVLLGRPLVWGAAVSYAIMVVSFVLAARRTTAANAIFIQYTGPVYVALLGGKLLGEKVTRRDLVAVGGCVVGMGLAFGGELGGGRMEGNLLAVVSSFGFAGLPLLVRLDQKRLESDAPDAAPRAPLVAMTLGNAIAAVVSVPAILAHPIAGDTAVRTYVVLVALGTLQIGLPYVLYAIAVRRLRALESSLLATIEPVLAPIWVVLATGERPSPLAIAGGAMIVLAVAAQAKRPRVAAV